MIAHTPGPWVVTTPEPNESVQELAVKHGELFVATVHDMASEQTHANARLIAAAPEMLEALRAWERWYSDDSSEFNRDEARVDGLAAIAKAEGRS